MLGSEAVYEVVEEGEEIVTAEVVSAPGLPRGKRVALLAQAARAMERFAPAQPLVPVSADAAQRPYARTN